MLFARFALSLLVLLTTGCVPSYRQPSAGLSETATLRPISGCELRRIDGKRPGWITFVRHSTPDWLESRVTAGEHRIQLIRYLGPQPVFMDFHPPKFRVYACDIKCDAGQTYTLEASVEARSVIVTNVGNGETASIECQISDAMCP